LNWLTDIMSAKAARGHMEPVSPVQGAAEHRGELLGVAQEAAVVTGEVQH